MGNPFIVEPEEKKIDLKPWTDRSGRIWNLWITVRNELSVGENRRMLKTISSVTQQIPKLRGEQQQPEAKLEWTEYSFARMVAYIVDWSLAHEPEYKLPATRASYEKLRDELFVLIDDALDEHELTIAREKKAQSTTPLPSAISA